MEGRTVRNYKFWVEASKQDEVLRCSDILNIFFGGEWLLGIVFSRKEKKSDSEVMMILWIF